jgi:excisionase family DNA binding protein
MTYPAPPHELPEWLGVDALARWLDVPERTVYMWRYRGDGPKAYKIGRHLRFRKSDIETWLAERADRQAV